VAIFLASGLTAETGLSFSLIRRLREPILAVVGLTALAIVRKFRPMLPLLLDDV